MIVVELVRAALLSNRLLDRGGSPPAPCHAHSDSPTSAYLPRCLLSAHRGLDGLDGETLKSLTSLLASFDQGGTGGGDGAMPAGLAALMGGGGGGNGDAAGTGLAELMGMAVPPGPLPGPPPANGGGVNVPH